MPTDEFFISPKYTNKSFGGSPSYEEKIMIFEDRVLGWQLNIAEELRKQVESDKRSPFQDAGFAILSILSSYFEMIAQFIEGRDSAGQSKSYFGKGLERVFPGQFHQSDMDMLYSRIRCGMFHSGLVKKGVLISNGYTKPIEYLTASDLVKINPLKLSMTLKSDFEKFVEYLKNGAGTPTQANFEAMFAVIGKGVYD